MVDSYQSAHIFGPICISGCWLWESFKRTNPSKSIKNMLPMCIVQTVSFQRKKVVNSHIKIIPHQSGSKDSKPIFHAFTVQVEIYWFYWRAKDELCSETFQRRKCPSRHFLGESRREGSFWQQEGLWPMFKEKMTEEQVVIIVKCGMNSRKLRC